jgi:hypothetical protein
MVLFVIANLQSHFKETYILVGGGYLLNSTNLNLCFFFISQRSLSVASP